MTISDCSYLHHVHTLSWAQYPRPEHILGHAPRTRLDFTRHVKSARKNPVMMRPTRTFKANIEPLTHAPLRIFRLQINEEFFANRPRLLSGPSLVR